MILEPELRKDVDCDQHWISGFAQWNGELLAFGWNGYGCGDGGNPMLWRSADGTMWDLVDLAGTTFAAEYPYPESAVETPDGRLAIFGSTHLGSVRVLFLTSDLETWETHRISDGETESYVASLAASPTVLIGVGSVVIGEREVETWTEEIHGPYVVTSPDGVTWTSAAPPVEEGTIAEIMLGRDKRSFRGRGDRCRRSAVRLAHERWQRMDADQAQRRADIHARREGVGRPHRGYRGNGYRLKPGTRRHRRLELS